MKQNKKIYINIIVNIFVIIVGISLLMIALNQKNIKQNYSYEVQRSSNYEILLNENNFYENSVLPCGYIYASKSINEVNIDFKYLLKGKTNY